MTVPNTTPPVLTPKDIERFWSKVDIRGADECWPWLGLLSPKLYGLFRLGGHDRRRGAKRRALRAHRVAYFLVTGDWPALLVCHKCDFRKCCNSAHLFLGTDTENIRDRHCKGRSAKGQQFAHRRYAARKGSDSPKSKLTEQQVLEIRRRYATGKITYARLAQDYAVVPTTIQMIINRTNWGHI